MIPLLLILSIIALGFFPLRVCDDKKPPKEEKWYVVVKRTNSTEIKEYKETR